MILHHNDKISNTDSNNNNNDTAAANHQAARRPLRASGTSGPAWSRSCPDILLYHVLCYNTI